MKPRLSTRHALQESLVALRIVAPKSLAVLEHRLGRLLRIIKAVVLRAQIILDDPDAAPQTHEHLSIFRLLHPERRRQMTRLGTCFPRRCVDGRQPLREKRNILPFLRRAEIAFQLLANQANGGRLQGRAKER